MNIPRRKIWVWALSSLLIVFMRDALAHRVLACEPEWAALAEELGGTMVTVYSATTGLQDPHRIEARPSLIARVRNADLLICTGLGIEEGWLPILLRESGNNRIQAGQPGYLLAGDYVEKLEVPKRLDRAEGHVDVQGNHHIQGDPRNILIVAKALAERLAQIDPAHEAYFQARYKTFSVRWREAMKRWEQSASPLKGLGLVEHHKAWPYLSRWLGLREVAVLEPKPGLEPTVPHLQEVVATLQRERADVIVRSTYNDGHAVEWLAERTKLPIVVLPITIGGSDKAKDLFSFYSDIIDRLLAASKVIR